MIISKSERIKKSLEAVDDLEYFISDSWYDIRNLSLHFADAPPGTHGIKLGHGASFDNARQVLPFLRKSINEGFWKLRGYIKFINHDEIVPISQELTLVGWTFGKSERIGPSRRKIMNSGDLRDLDPWMLANQALIDELILMNEVLRSAKLTCGRGDSAITFFPSLKETSMDGLLHFIKSQANIDQEWTGSIIMSSGVEYHPVLKDGSLSYWFRKSYTII